MRTNQIEGWVERLQLGMIELFDLEQFERLNTDELIRELARAYPVRFLDRRKGDKLEVGLAQCVRSSKRWATTAFEHCLLLTGERGALTSLAVMTRLQSRPSRRASGELELTSGAGFSVYHDPDGWRIKLLHDRTVSLTEESLTKRGWLMGTVGAVGAK